MAFKSKTRLQTTHRPKSSQKRPNLTIPRWSTNKTNKEFQKPAKDPETSSSETFSAKSNSNKETFSKRSISALSSNKKIRETWKTTDRHFSSNGIRKMTRFNKEVIWATPSWRLLKNLSNKMLIKSAKSSQMPGKIRLINKWLKGIGEFSGRIIRFMWKEAEFPIRSETGTRCHN